MTVRAFSLPVSLAALCIAVCSTVSAQSDLPSPGNAAAGVPIFLALALPDAPSSSLDSLQQSTAQAVPPSEASIPQQATPPPNETDAQRKQREREESERQVKAQEKQRIAGVVPDFNVVLGGYAPPLTPRQKFDLVFHSATDPFTIATAFVLGGYDEVSGAHNGYGWGPGGYFDRVGAQYGDTVNGAIIGNAILPILLHQDPRYFRKGTGTIKSRVLYSALSTVICRGDNGRKEFNISNVAGNYISGAISNAYYPASERGIGLTLSNGTVVTAEGAVAAQVLEFSPDVIARIKAHHQAAKDRKAAAAAQPTR